MSKKILADTYNPKNFEDDLYEHWETEGFFKKSPLLHLNSTFVWYTTFGGASNVKNDFDYRG